MCFAVREGTTPALRFLHTCVILGLHEIPADRTDLVRAGVETKPCLELYCTVQFLILCAERAAAAVMKIA